MTRGYAYMLGIQTNADVVESEASIMQRIQVAERQLVKFKAMPNPGKVAWATALLDDLRRSQSSFDNFVRWHDQGELHAAKDLQKLQALHVIAVESNNETAATACEAAICELFNDIDTYAVTADVSENRTQSSTKIRALLACAVAQRNYKRAGVLRAIMWRIKLEQVTSFFESTSNEALDHHHPQLQEYAVELTKLLSRMHSAQLAVPELSSVQAKHTDITGMLCRNLTTSTKQNVCSQLLAGAEVT